MDLIRNRNGWTYPDPGPCTCGETNAWVSFQFCQCTGAIGGGHPSWRCRACDEVRTLGCVGRVEVLNEYGGAGAQILPRERRPTWCAVTPSIGVLPYALVKRRAAY